MQFCSALKKGKLCFTSCRPVLNPALYPEGLRVAPAGLGKLRKTLVTTTVGTDCSRAGTVFRQSDPVLRSPRRGGGRPGHSMVAHFHLSFHFIRADLLLRRRSSRPLPRPARGDPHPRVSTGSESRVKSVMGLDARTPPACPAHEPRDALRMPVMVRVPDARAESKLNRGEPALLT